MNAMWTILILAAFAPSFVGESSQDIRAQVKQHGDIEQILIREHPPADLRALVVNADLVVRAVVLGGESSLVNNKVSTNYSVQVLSVIRGELERTTITVHRDGGKVALDGGSVLAYDPEFPSFQPTEEYVLFLRRSAEGVYIVPLGAQGAFRVDGGKISQALRDGPWNREKPGMTLLQFFDEIAAAAKKQESGSGEGK